MSKAYSALTRRLYHEDIVPGTVGAVWAESLLKVLISQDGSATLLCETLSGGDVRLDLIYQIVTDDVPEIVRTHLSGDRFIERQVCLSNGDEVMMDNLSYIATEMIDPEDRGSLEAGCSPIGHIFGRRWTRKTPIPSPESIQAQLWQRSGLPDPSAVRSYLLEAPQGVCMLITETFRRGMRSGLPIVAA